MKRHDFPFVPESFFRQEYRLTRLAEHAEMFLYAIVSVSLPFILGHQQLLVGAAVNCALVLAALNLRGKSLLPIILLPSIGAYIAGYVFGASSTALLFMIPAIWIGNALLVFSIKEFALERKANRVAALAGGAAAKSAFLFAVAFVLYSFALVPAQFLTAMGVFQLMTAAMGGGAALVLQEGKRRFLAS